MADQLALDFTLSSAQRQRRAKKDLEPEEAKADQLDLFAVPWAPNIDVHLDGPDEAVASISGKDPERAHDWLSGLVGGNLTVRKSRRVAFPVRYLDRFLTLRPPAQVTLDAAAAAVGRAIWADKLGLKPLRVYKDGRRLVATSTRRWPSGFSIKDVPWGAIHACVLLDLPLDVEASAEQAFVRKLTLAGAKVATSALAGSAVTIETSRPALVENLHLPGLAYDGPPRTGRYRLPILSAEPLLRQQIVEVPDQVRQAIQKATSPIKPLTGLPESFPWKLYDFQAADAGRGLRILETTGGVLLAGDMGSGKTTVSLALAQHLDLFPLLVVSPLSAFSTWARQLGEMNRNFYLATEAPAKSWQKIEENDYEAVVMSLDRPWAFLELLERKNFRGVIADEVQRIRTPGSRRSRALRQIAGAIPYRLGLSGTPLTNTVADVLPLGAFLVPGEWRPRANEKDLEDMYPGDPTEALAEHLGSIMVRRRMDQVGRPLPKRNDHRIQIQLTPEQRRAIAALEAEAEAAKEAGEFDDNSGRMHAFAKLQKMRQIINSPAAAGVPGPNPKVSAAIDMAKEFLAKGRKGVIFCADRTTFREIGKRLDEESIGWVGIWGATPPGDRIENERKFHAGDPAPNGNPTDVVVCTIQAGAESWSASPTGTWLISTAYVYAPSTLAQMEARVHRMNSDLNGPEIEIMYIHAMGAGTENGSLDDRMVEILAVKQQLFAQVVDRRTHTDNTQIHYSMSDLVYLMTGTRDKKRTAAEKDAAAAVKREQDQREHARKTLYKHKRNNADLIGDDGSSTHTLEEAMEAGLLDSTDDLQEMLEQADLEEGD